MPVSEVHSAAMISKKIITKVFSLFVLLTPCCENGDDGDPESVVLYIDIYKKDVS